MSVCRVSVPSQKTRFPVDWRLLVEECIANSGIPLDIFRSFLFQWLFSFCIFLCFFGSLRTSLLCISGELEGGGSAAVAVVVSDRWQVTRDTRQATFSSFLLLFLPFCLFWYRCYYPHRSRDSVSPICGIFFIKYCQKRVIEPYMSFSLTVFWQIMDYGNDQNKHLFSLNIFIFFYLSTTPSSSCRALNKYSISSSPALEPNNTFKVICYMYLEPNENLCYAI